MSPLYVVTSPLASGGHLASPCETLAQAIVVLKANGSGKVEVQGRTLAYVQDGQVYYRLHDNVIYQTSVTTRKVP